MYKPYMVIEKLPSGNLGNYYFDTEDEALKFIKELQVASTFYSARYAPFVKVFQDDGFKFV